ncbi:MAG TPA: hypothetical protein VLB46_11660 [Pyrinomonadaceae bacterium]|nr:hypothetical protein [Pyrinomonadaceae bacterium]
MLPKEYSYNHKGKGKDEDTTPNKNRDANKTSLPPGQIIPSFGKRFEWCLGNELKHTGEKPCYWYQAHTQTYGPEGKLISTKRDSDENNHKNYGGNRTSLHFLEG